MPTVCLTELESQNYIAQPAALLVEEHNGCTAWTS